MDEKEDVETMTSANLNPNGDIRYEVLYRLNSSLGVEEILGKHQFMETSAVVILLRKTQLDFTVDIFAVFDSFSESEKKKKENPPKEPMVSLIALVR